MATSLSKTLILETLLASQDKNVKAVRRLCLLGFESKDTKKEFKDLCGELEESKELFIDEAGAMSTKEKVKEVKKEKKEKKEKKRKQNEEGVEEEQEQVVSSKKAKQQPMNEWDYADGDDNNNNDANEQDQEEQEAEEVDPDEALNKNNPVNGNRNGETRLFLGNLPFKVDEQALTDFLAPAKWTHVKWITDKESGRFYGSAFIEVRNSKDGAIAVTQKNGGQCMGRDVKITFSPAREGDIWPPVKNMRNSETGKDREGGQTTGGAAGSYGTKTLGVKPEGCTKLFIGNLSYDIDDDALFKFFMSVEVEVKAVRWLHHKDSGDFKGVGYVEFWSEDACGKGAKLNGKNLLGRPIRIDWTD